MHPRRGLGLAPAEQAPMPQGRGMLLEADQDDQQPILRRGQRAVLRGRVASHVPAPPRPCPVGPVAQDRRLTGGYQRRKLLHSQAGQISHVSRLGGEIATASHELSLRSWRGQYHPKPKS
jgi:hypothetical protein